MDMITLHTDLLALEILDQVRDNVKIMENANVKHTLHELGMDSLQTCELELDLEKTYDLKLRLDFEKTDTCLTIAHKVKIAAEYKPIKP
jgi:acyl carrier protein